MMHRRRPNSDKPKSEKLNKGLDPSKFEICVPKASTLLVPSWNDETKWIKYVNNLAKDYGLPPIDEYPDCRSCDCKPGWILQGDYAIAHACRVHDHIYRQVLAFEHVSAIDVGFAIWERRKTFGKFLSIRIHVNQKLPPELLFSRGLASFNDPNHADSIRERLSKRRDFRQEANDGGSETDARNECPCNLKKSGQCPCPDAETCCCKQSEEYLRLQKLLSEEGASEGHELQRERLGKFPIRGVLKEDLSIFCPPDVDIPEEFTLDDVRLCICGVPIDIINAQYSRTSIRHPGGDDEMGTFVDPPLGNNELTTTREQLLIARGRVNPLVGGISVGTVTAQAGTLSTIVWDRTDGTPCVLSNWHVLAGTPTARVGQPVYQPGLFDGGRRDDVVAYLKRWHLGEEGDAAIAELCGNRDYASGEVLGFYQPISGYLEPKLNMEVRKCGRTTGYTEGFVDGIHLATNIDYGGGVVRFFKNQFHIAPLKLGEDVSQTGDSGSLVVTSFRPAELHDDLGKIREWLHRCSSPQSQNKLCCEIKDQLKEWREEYCCEQPSKCQEDICDIIEHAQTNITKVCSHSDPSQFLCCWLFNVVGSWLCAASTSEDPTQCLCCIIKQTLEKLEVACQPICQKITCLADFTIQLTDIERRAHNLSSNRKRLRRRKKLLKDLGDILDKLNRFPGPELPLFNDLNDEFRKRKDSQDFNLDEFTDKSLSKFQSELDHLKMCLDFCQKVEMGFRGWYKTCRSIVFCEKLAGILRTLLKDHNDESTHDLIERIEKELANLHECPTQTTQHRAKPNAAGADLPNEADLKKLKDKLEAIGNETGVVAPWFKQLLVKTLNDDPDLLHSLIEQTTDFQYDKDDQKNRQKTRAFYAVGMLFAGDTPGSPFGEFAVASEISRLADELRFSLRPVFEPRSSFRELRVRPNRQVRGTGTSGPGRGLTPGDQGADPRGGGPQPETEPFQTSSESGSGGG